MPLRIFYNNMMMFKIFDDILRNVFKGMLFGVVLGEW